VVLALILVAWYVIVHSKQVMGFLVLGSLFLFIGAIMCVGLVLVTYSRTQTWAIGAEGEEMVERMLRQLGNPYRVIHDIVLPGSYGNIDHLVLGPNGVFAVETKNHNGSITCDGDTWFQRKVGRHGTPYYGKIGCPSKQVKRKAVMLNNLLHKKLNLNLYVNVIVVFANPYATLRILNPTVTVLRPNQLVGYLTSYGSQKLLRNETIEEMDKALLPYSRFR